VPVQSTKLRIDEQESPSNECVSTTKQSFQRANNGEAKLPSSYLNCFQKKVESDHGFNPGWIEFDQLVFHSIQALDAVP
jgi:hypothetical protein